MDGFKLHGESNLTCGVTGAFNYPFPVCEGKFNNNF